MILDGKPIPVEDMPPAAGVELVQEGEHYYLYRVASTGEAAGDTWHESMKHAKDQAAFEYEIQESDWKLAIPIWDEWKPPNDVLSEDQNLEWALKMLLQHLQALAADADTLLRAYPPDCDAVNELVNDFDHFLRCSGTAVQHGLVGEGYFDQAHLVDRKLDEMSQRHKPGLWTAEALRTKVEWSEVRLLAELALKSMGYDLEPPPPRSF